MTITIHAYWIPIIITIFCAVMALRPYRQSNDYDFGIIFRAFWIVPVLFTWMLFFAINLWVKS